MLFLKRKARAEGVSEQTLNDHNDIQYISRAIELDRQQAGRVQNVILMRLFVPIHMAQRIILIGC